MPTNLAKRLGGHIQGSRFSVEYSNASAANGALTANIFMADKACKLISAKESHGTVAGGADVLNFEKCESGEDLAAGDLVLTTGFTINSTANTPVTQAAVTTAAAVFAAGDRLCARLTTGTGASYAEGTWTFTFEYI